LPYWIIHPAFFCPDYPAWRAGQLDIAKILKNVRGLSEGGNATGCQKSKKAV
jgi:hypothetical protein